MSKYKNKKQILREQQLETAYKAMFLLHLMRVGKRPSLAWRAKCKNELITRDQYYENVIHNPNVKAMIEFIHRVPGLMTRIIT